LVITLELLGDDELPPHAVTINDKTTAIAAADSDERRSPASVVRLTPIT
jgi:hypothetical protein